MPKAWEDDEDPTVGGGLGSISDLKGQPTKAELAEKQGHLGFWLPHWGPRPGEKPVKPSRKRK
jgi:hypothetical protein